MPSSRTTLFLSTSALAPLASLALAVPASGQAGAADQPTCQGQTATVVGTAGEPVTGTAGDDVIVSNGATSVTALAGDDLVCVTGAQDQSTNVDAGTGDDSVAAGTNGQRDHDVIDLGEGDDRLILSGLPGTEANYTGGAGTNTLENVSSDRIPWRLDSFAGEIRAQGPTVNADDFVIFDADQLNFSDLQYIGGPKDETLDLGNGSTSHRNLDVRMGNGDDTITLPTPFIGGVHGGPGHNTINVEGPPTGRAEHNVDVELQAKALKVDGDKRISLHSFSVVRVDHVASARIQGMGAAEDLSAYACRATINGGGGSDRILSRRGDGCFDSPHYLHSHGGDGNDLIDGTSGNDLLIGGPGNDTAYGRGGRKDACSAEHEHSCERRP